MHAYHRGQSFQVVTDKFIMFGDQNAINRIGRLSSVSFLSDREFITLHMEAGNQKRVNLLVSSDDVVPID